MSPRNPLLVTEPLRWITGSMASTLGSILGFALVYSFGSYLYWGEDWIFFFMGGGLLNLPLSIFYGWGFIAIPLAWYLYTSLLEYVMWKTPPNVSGSGFVCHKRDSKSFCLRYWKKRLDSDHSRCMKI